jgi:uncharacterized protein YndB with AHSA1/START domain
LSPKPASKDYGAATGTVGITIATTAAPEVVWVALTDVTVVGQWFGNLSSDLAPGATARLDFGDGDFFSIENVRADRPHLLEYAWRFLGIGALDSITWRILPKGSGCLVSVTDSEPERSREWAQELRSGWLDFTQRLERFLQTGEPSRYDWSREIHASIELGQALRDAERSLFTSASRQAEWVPLGIPSPRADGRAAEEDGPEPARFYTTKVVKEGPSHFRFELGCDEWLNATKCYLELSPRRSGSMLSVRHAGWEAISWERNDQLEQRKRFCGVWIDALKRARQLVEENSSSRQ